MLVTTYVVAAIGSSQLEHIWRSTYGDCEGYGGSVGGDDDGEVCCFQCWPCVTDHSMHDLTIPLESYSSCTYWYTGEAFMRPNRMNND